MFSLGTFCTRKIPGLTDLDQKHSLLFDLGGHGGRQRHFENALANPLCIGL
jgi:hypothetical protein